MNVIEAIHGRRSIRAYRPDPVAREVLEDIVWAAAQAPTPPLSGDMPWVFCIIEGTGRIDEFGIRAKRYAQDHQPPGRPWTWADRPEFRVFWGAPVVLLICARRGNPETAQDCCRAGQNVVLAARHHGLGSCWVGAPMPWLHSPGVMAELGLPPDCEAEAAIVLGHAAESPKGNPRPRPGVVWHGAPAPRLA
jgi:nitroreductase